MPRGHSGTGTCWRAWSGCAWRCRGSRSGYHGMPAFGIVGRPAFANLHTHPDDGRPTLWFKAAPGVQGELVDQEPERFFVPPYVGPRGWVGLRLDVDLDWDEVADVAEQSWRLTAPKRLVREFDGE